MIAKCREKHTLLGMKPGEVTSAILKDVARSSRDVGAFMVEAFQWSRTGSDPHRVRRAFWQTIMRCPDYMLPIHWKKHNNTSS